MEERVFGVWWSLEFVFLLFLVSCFLMVVVLIIKLFVSMFILDSGNKRFFLVFYNVSCSCLFLISGLFYFF